MTGKLHGKREFGRPNCRQKDSAKTGFRKICSEDVDWNSSGRDTMSGFCEHGNERSGPAKAGDFLIS